MAGKPYAAQLATGLTKPKQRVLGMGVSGVEETVGAEVTRFKVGDAVFGASLRTFAEFTCAHEDQLCAQARALEFRASGGVGHFRLEVETAINTPAAGDQDIQRA